MRQTLFIIPYEVLGVPIFGVGLLLAAWAVGSVILIVSLARQHGWKGDTLGHLPSIALAGALVLFLPRLFPGGLPIRGYGVMLLLAIAAGLWLGVKRSNQIGLASDLVFALAMWMFVPGIVAARLFYVVQYWESDFQADSLGGMLLKIINIPQGGLVVLGALMGGAVGFFAFVHLHRLPWTGMADVIAPSLALGLAIGRIGCLMNGCCYGGPSEQPWAIVFPPGSPPYLAQLEQGRLTSDLYLRDDRGSPATVGDVADRSVAWQAGLRPGQVLIRVGGVPIESASQAYRALNQQFTAGQPIEVEMRDGLRLVLTALPVPAHSRPVHPTQIYSVIGGLLLCLLLYQFYPFRRRDGEVVALMLTIYPIMRFLLERIRVDQPPVAGTGLTISQNLSVVILLVAVFLWLHLLAQPKQQGLWDASG